MEKFTNIFFRSAKFDCNSRMVKKKVGGAFICVALINQAVNANEMALDSNHKQSI